MTARPLACLVLACVLAGAARAQTLTVNGHQQASVPTGRTMLLELDGPVGAPVILGFDTDPGPTRYAGVSVPLGLGEGLAIAAAGVPFPASGMLALGVPIPSVQALEGIVLYAAALIVDPAAPFGLVVSNQAVMRFVRRPEAGPDTAGFVGDPLTLDGSDTLAAGDLQAGAAMSWSVITAPPTAIYSLDGADTAHPTLTTDTAGFYRLALDLIVTGTTGGARDLCEAHVFGITATGPGHGAFFDVPSLVVPTLVSGPAGASFRLAGQGSSSNGAFFANVAAGSEPTTTLEFAATSVKGDRARRRVTYFANAGRPIASSIANAAGVHLTTSGLEALEAQLEQGVDVSALTSEVSSVPSTTAPSVIGPFGFVIFSGTFDPTSATIGGSPQLELVALPGKLQVQVTLTNFNMSYVASGLLSNVPYSVPGSVHASSIVYSADVTTVVGGGGAVSTVQSSTCNVSGISASFGIIPSSFIQPLLSSFESTIENAIEDTLDEEVPILIDGVLDAPFMVDLGAFALELDLSGVVYAAGSATLRYGAQTLATMPPTSQIDTVWHSPQQFPSFGTLSPTGLVYDLGQAAADDLVNQIYAESQRAEPLLATVDGVIDVGQGPIALEAQVFDSLFPGLGFDRLEPATPLRVRTVASVPPLLQSTPAGTWLVHLGDAVVAVEAEVGPGHWAPVLRVGVTSSTAVEPIFEPNVTPSWHAIALLPDVVQLSATALTSLAGIDADGGVAALAPVLEHAVRALVADLPPIVVPNLPYDGGTSAEIPTDGAASGYLSLYSN